MDALSPERAGGRTGATGQAASDREPETDTTMKTTERFSDRVENYVRYRPGYPAAVVSMLAEEAGLTPGSVVVDVGSGTGISSELFLRHGNRVLGVEPNREMREAAERLLAAYPGFRSVDGTAEATTLDPGIADLVVAGQGFRGVETSCPSTLVSTS